MDSSISCQVDIYTLIRNCLATFLIILCLNICSLQYILRQEMIAEANMKPSNFQNALSSSQATLSQLQHYFYVIF